MLYDRKSFIYLCGKLKDYLSPLRKSLKLRKLAFELLLGTAIVNDQIRVKKNKVLCLNCVHFSYLNCFLVTHKL